MPLDQDPNDTRQLEATELEDRPPEPASRPAPVPQEALSRVRKWQDKLRRFWNRQVVLTVGHEQCRDHFGEFIEDWKPENCPTLLQYVAKSFSRMF